MNATTSSYTTRRSPTEWEGDAEAPIISVFIAAYNCAPYIAAAIESALNGQGVPLEVIVVDDASTDGTADIARSYTKQWPVRVFVSSTNRGPSHSRNVAIREARGAWLAQLDADDWFAPGRLSTLLRMAQDAQVDLVADDMFLVDDATLKATSTRFIDNGALLRGARVITPADLVKFDLGSIKPLIKREFLLAHNIAYPHGIRYGEDFLLLLESMLAEARVLIVSTPMYHLRRGNTGSATTNRPQLLAQIGATTRQLMSDSRIQANHEIFSALSQRLTFVDRLAALSAVVGTLKSGRIAPAIRQLIAKPTLLVSLLQRAPEVIAIRVRRRRFRNLLAQSWKPPRALITESSQSKAQESSWLHK